MGSWDGQTRVLLPSIGGTFILICLFCFNFCLLHILLKWILEVSWVMVNQMLLHPNLRLNMDPLTPNSITQHHPFTAGCNSWSPWLILPPNPAYPYPQHGPANSLSFSPQPHLLGKPPSRKDARKAQYYIPDFPNRCPNP